MGSDRLEAGSAGDDNLCRRCGRCCLEKFVIDDVVIITDVPCEHLDPETRLCRMYGRRHTSNWRCLTATEAAAAGALPGDCPYVADRPDYTAPVELATHPDYAEELPEEYDQMRQNRGVCPGAEPGARVDSPSFFD